MVFVKTLTFFHIFFFEQRKPERNIFDILDRKECFLDHKRKVLKNRHFQSCWSMVFVNKSTFFFYVFFSKKSQKESFFEILDSKEFFLDLKSEVLAKSKKSTFCKGVSPWFLSKNRPFSYMPFFLAKKAKKKHFLIFWIENKAFWTSKVKS